MHDDYLGCMHEKHADSLKTQQEVSELPLIEQRYLSPLTSWQPMITATSPMESIQAGIGVGESNTVATKEDPPIPVKLTTYTEEQLRDALRPM